MDSNTPPKWKQSHSWAALDRANPNKRAAEKRVSDFHEIYSLFDEQTVREQATRCIQCPEASCVTGCPLHNRIPEWLALAAEGDFLGAAEISRSTSNMPEICSRVCPQERLCEGSCLLNSRTEPVCIGAIEKFINEYALSRGAGEVQPAAPNGLNVAVVGSGPGGMACADELAKLGYTVTIFESQEVPGGLLMNGIPAFKLEKSIVSRRIDLLKQRGVLFNLNTTVGRDVTFTDLLSKYNAVFLGFGAQKAKPLDVPGTGLEGVYQSLPFLVEKNVSLPLDAKPIEVEGKHVVVLGGGDTAMDCLRTAIRCGAMEATCVYRRDLANMPGSKKEYANALEEGAQFLFLTNPVALEANAAGQVSSVKCVKMELGEPDAGGRRKPRAVKGSEFSLRADVILVAYGFDPISFPPQSGFSKIQVNEWGGLVLDKYQMTNIPGVFGGGDAGRGPSLVVHAVRDGRIAAEGIDHYLGAKRG